MGGNAALFLVHGYADLHGNHVLKDTGWAVRLHDYSTLPPIVVELTDNYWGTADRDSIAAWIKDGNDDPNIHGFVQFEPFVTTTAVGDGPSEGRLEIRSIPNPFNPSLVIQDVLPRAVTKSVRVYDVRGRMVRTLASWVLQEAGAQEVSWDGRDDSGAVVASGTYVVRLQAGAETRTVRVSLVR